MSTICGIVAIYKVYGLKIKSEILIPELSTIGDQECGCFDATISCGKVPKEIEDPIYKNELIQISKSEFRLHVRGVANYYVVNGNNIVVEPETGSDVEEVKLFLLGTSLGVMLIQRNTIAVHGGTIVIDGKGIIITGQSGAGKSTLISAFGKDGYSFLADDVSALENTVDKGIIVHPTYPRQKLCRDVMENMGYDVNKFFRIDPCRDKYAIYLDKNFLQYPVPLCSIYEINIGTSSKVEICEVLGSEKIKILLRNIYRVELCEHIGFNPQYFKYCLDIAKNLRVYRITRPMGIFSVDDQMKLIKDTLNIIDGGQK